MHSVYCDQQPLRLVWPVSATPLMAEITAECGLRSKQPWSAQVSTTRNLKHGLSNLSHAVSAQPRWCLHAKFGEAQS